jgi:RHS repeat-associated protein
MRKVQTLVLSLALAPATLLAQYSYYYTDSLTSISSSYWTSNGTATGSFDGFTASGTGGGSVIFSNTMPGPTGEYEVATTLTLASGGGGGTYISYLNASSNALSGSSLAGTFYDVEIYPTFSGGSCTASLTLNKSGSGGFSTLASTTVGCASGMVMRAIHIAGSEIIVYINDIIVLSAVDSELTSGHPGVGARGITGTGNAIGLTQLGELDTTSPNAFNSSLIGTSSFSNRVDIQSPGVSDNTGGTGIAFYAIYRGGTYMATLPSPEWSDTTVATGTTYGYQLAAYDYDLNSVLSSTFYVTTPGSGGIDPRQVGVRPTGAYWGAAPEQINLLSGNLSYSLPLLRAQGRNGWGVGFSLGYNSQNWRKDLGGTWDLGRDVGYGYGWKLMAGSITPYWSGYYTLDHWTFTDATGAEYRLTINSSGVWTSKESVYLSYNANTDTLNFPDGSFWTMGATSAGSEQDAGTLYPTVMEDTNGNQVLISYADGIGVSWSNSSARITSIADVRAVNSGGSYWSYHFAYNSDAIPHLTGISNNIGTGETYSLSYRANTLIDPFASSSYGSTSFLTQATLPNTTSYAFTYDGSTSTNGDLTKVTLPYLGYLDWSYSDIQYSGSRYQMEVGTRGLYDGTSTLTYPIYHESGTSSLTIHACATVDDPTGGVGEKYWAFSASGANQGLATHSQGRTLTGTTTCSSSPASTAMTQNDLTWTQDSAGNNYLGELDTYADPGTSNAIEKKTFQTVDLHGNVTQVINYDWGGSSAARTYNYSYSTALSNIFNRLTSATVTYGSTTLTIESISYDQTSLASASGAQEWDSGYSGARGNPTTITDASSNTTTVSYDIYGDVVGATVNGVASTASLSTTTNFAAPNSVAVGGLTTSMTYSSFLGVSTQVGPNSNTVVDIGYDSEARPISSQSPFGATTYYAYNDTSTPPNVCASVNYRWTQTNLDGLGRTVEILTGSYPTSGETGCARGTGASTLSETDIGYSYAGVSPMGKTVSRTVPYSGSVGATTSYTYDAIGRTLTVTNGASDTTGTTYYTYWGRTVESENNTTVGNWKEFASDAFGNVIEVAEPNPAGGYFVTNYTYDLLNNLTGIPEIRGSTTPTRTWTYSGKNLTSATNPENGTVNYWYNSTGYGTGKVRKRVDAKNQEVDYTYDALSRLTMVQRFPTSGGSEDTCQRETYYYDGNEPSPPDGYAVYPSYPANASGRLSGIMYQGGYNPTASPTCDTTFIELYTYNSGGAPTGKLLQVSRIFNLTYSSTVSYPVNLTASFGYDNEGRMTSVGYPSMVDEWGVTSTGPTLGYAYDAMGRLYSMTDTGAGNTLISSASYGSANELTNITGTSYSGSYSETRTYNSIKQLTRVNSGGLDIEYNYPTSQNIGKIASQTDMVSGETVTYTYDALNRLITAQNQTGFSPLWGQGYTYDTFGNLTGVSVTQGSAPTLSVGYDSNSHAGGEDYNGNPGSIYLPADGSSYSATWDIENRLTSTGSSTIYYSYAPGNNRVWRGTGSFVTQSSGGSGQCSTGQWNANDEITFWGVDGKRLSTFQLTESPNGHSSQCDFSATAGGSNYYFGGKLLKKPSGWVYADGVGSFSKSYPYGQDRPSATTNGTEKFTGYFRDAETGNDYAVNRYMTPGMGRFITPDRKSGVTTDPGSWNKYAYAGGDPINRIDPSGQDWCIGGDPNNCVSDAFCDAGPGDATDPSETYVDFCDSPQAQYVSPRDVNSDIDSPDGAVGFSTAADGSVIMSVFNGVTPQVSAEMVTGDPPDWQAVFAQVTSTNPDGFINYFMLSSVLTGLGGLEGAAATEATTLYRAVGPAELANIRLTGNYARSPGGLTVKYFYPTSQQATSFAANPSNSQFGPFTLTSTTASTSWLNSLAETTPVATEGLVITIPNEHLPSLTTPIIHPTMPLK